MNPAAFDPPITGVYILMATFNGERYLRAQLESIRGQSLCDWVLLVRDDGSTDQSTRIVRDYTARDPRIILISDTFGHLGPVRCFACLLQLAYDQGARYVACSDQDDIWLPEKLADACAVLVALEARDGESVPTLVHSDLEVVNAHLLPISPSFMHFERINNPASPPLPVVVVQNHVVGCTLTANRALLALALPVPPDVRMHDWWLALCAKAAGTVHFLPKVSVKYRQHGRNTLGAAGFQGIYHVFSGIWWARLVKRPRLHHDTLVQSGHLMARMAERGSAGQALAAEHLWRCMTTPLGVQRVRMAYRAGLRGQNGVASGFFYVFLVLGLGGYARETRRERSDRRYE